MNSIKSFFKMLLFLFKYSKKVTIGIILFTIILGLLPVFETYYIAYITTTVFKNFNILNILLLMAGYVLILVIKKIINYFYENFRIKSRVVFSNKLSSLIISKSLNIDMLYKQTSQYQDLEKRAKEAINIDKVMMLINTLCNILISLISIVSFAIYLFTINYWTIIIIFTLFIITYPIRKKANQGFFNIFRLLTNDNRKLSEYENALISPRSIVELKVNNGIAFMKNKWSEQYDKNKKIELKEKVKNKTLTSIVSLVNDVFSILLQYVVLVLNNSFTIFNISYVTKAQNTIVNSLSSVGINLSYSYSVYESFVDFFKYIEIKDMEYKERALENNPIGIKIENVRFKYDSVDVLNGINLEIKPREKIMIVGENGSGKSTLAKLILGYYNPTCGKVLYFEEDTIMNKHPNISALLQHPVRFMTTIKENIIVSDLKQKYDDEKLNLILDRYDIKSETNVLDLNSQIGLEFGGTDLSGGQWQRLCFARTMYKEKSGLIIFDEPNQALDSRIEDKYLNLMFENKNSTILIIAHRLIFSKKVDKIIYMEKGQIIECGTHDELMNLKGKYFNMYSLQANQFNS